MRAFCPGHITGFFAVDVDSPEPLKQGSVGVGFCVENGATASVSRKDSKFPFTRVTFNGAVDDAPVTKQAIDMMGDGRSIRSDIEFAAPLGQGLGLSAAGTYATCIALAELVGKSKDDALVASHSSEVHHKTGLGDAVAQSVGGFVQRIRAGVPPLGSVKKIDIDVVDVVICLMEGGIDTPSILTSPDLVRDINNIGIQCIDEFNKKPDLENFINQSWKFATETGLATPGIAEVVDAIAGIGCGSMIMLGNGVFAFGDAEALDRAMSDFGQIIKTKVHHLPAGLLV